MLKEIHDYFNNCNKQNNLCNIFEDLNIELYFEIYIYIYIYIYISCVSNKTHPNLKVTIKIKINNRLPFVERQTHETISYSVHCMSTW